MSTDSLTKAQKRNLRRSRIRREWKEYKSTQYNEVISKTCEEDQSQFSVFIHVYDYYGGAMNTKDFPKGTPFETIYNAFSTDDTNKFLIKPENISIDGPMFKKTIIKKYKITGDYDYAQSVYKTAYRTLMNRSNNTWEQPPYDVNCDHEMPQWYGEAAYIELMEESGGKWKPDV